MADWDWDTILMSIDWSANDWHDFNWDECQHIIPHLRTETINDVARRQTRAGQTDFSPIHIEQMRRFNIGGNNSSSPPAPPDAHQDPRAGGANPEPSPMVEMSSDPVSMGGVGLSAPLRNFFVAPGLVPDPRDMSDEFGDPPLPAMMMNRAEGVERIVEEPTLTVSLQLGVAIAMAKASRNIGDPHPDDMRPLIDEPQDRGMYDAQLQVEFAQHIVTQLQGDACQFICVLENASEDGPNYLADVKQATMAEYGADPHDESTLQLESRSPTRGTSSQEVEEEALKLLSDYCGLPHTALEKPSWTWDMVETMCATMRQGLKKSMRWGRTMRNRIGDRAAELLKQGYFKAKRDRFHIYLPGVKPRHRCWCLKPWPRSTFGQHVAPWVRNRHEDYVPLPTFWALDPQKAWLEEHYKMFYGTLHTSVQPWKTWEWYLETSAMVAEACYQLRAKFRVHRDMPTIDAGTVVNVGHTEGFTLPQLKRIVTLWAVVEPTMMKLHREHRYKRHDVDDLGPGARWAGGAPLVWCSRLGGAAQCANNIAVADVVDWRHVFPRVPEQTYDHLMNEMLFWVPAEWLQNISRAEQMFLQGIWTCTSVNKLVEVMDSRWPDVYTTLRLRCSGERRTEVPDVNGEPQTVEFTGMQGSLDRAHLMAMTAVCAEFVSFAVRGSENRQAYMAFFDDQLNILARLGVRSRDIDVIRQGYQRQNEYWEPGDPEVSWDDPFWTLPPESGC